MRQEELRGTLTNSAVLALQGHGDVRRGKTHRQKPPAKKSCVNWGVRATHWLPRPSRMTWPEPTWLIPCWAAAPRTANGDQPLGMPCTIDRVLDAAIAACCIRALAARMHPVKLCSMRSESRKAIVHLQRILDDGRPAAVLSVDMSKTFEINPYL